ncbi:hypothetical protein [Oryzisolibacter sp. LB2S]|uniref:hypothetical protein n=1 Tax=Alicycliphilus soli TaxID=3228789 RepID=UPI0034578EE7
MKKWNKYAALCAATLLLLEAPSIAPAADLSNGLKELTIGLSKKDALAILEKQETDTGGIFAPACSLQEPGESCTTAVTNLTIGKLPLLSWSLNFDMNGRLARIGFLLSKRGCVDSDFPHPRLQFQNLSLLLDNQLGKPDSEQKHAAVWIDRKGKSGLILSLYDKEIPGIGYPNCPVVSISLTARDFSEKLSSRASKAFAKENDL